MNRRRLYRCRHDQRLGGVAAGVAEYFDLDPTLVRVLWLVSIFFGGLTILLYFAMWIIVPVEPATAPPYGPWQPGSSAWGAAQGPAANPGDAATAADPNADPNADPAAGPAGYPPEWRPTDWHAGRPERSGFGGAGTFFGMILILLGGVALVDQVLPRWGWHVETWPLFVVGLGILLVARSVRLHTDEP